ncbi:MAG TPA: AAA family ATPase [Gordonia sp. (in: high G+C Gram-positive bacteria)]|uniref:AAA family ATPase n=1 Tax=unclassified Gordonia (in: high G+C Gram-positive bacteria) TaxID=2657482 RepID=UPI000F9E8092|nr:MULTISPECIES: AAA family ATPase [unclassified Gordonia (in: high G+C Gram-positive bacteria)]RUP37404.1 MAG: AAA family ATPase [Gordonia sp. (in: high G+C Gram-positive bacteria)]HNP56465.1 AAA family ATPase [Gordonia sp. (in: high G+C Gram-positive bacteria)]HRC50216.1 AAA family ATPase [Gordonia sp. (in: high G+C Gram-positive bacteria)]
MAGSDTELIVDATRSEVKRWGGESPGYLHLAVVLARRWPTEFDEEFGDEGLRPIEKRLGDAEFIGDEAGVREVLDAGSHVEILAKLKELISAAPDGPSVVLTKGASPAVVPTTGGGSGAAGAVEDVAGTDSAEQDAGVADGTPAGGSAVEHGGTASSSVPEGEKPARDREQILGLAKRVKAEAIVGREAEHREVAALLLAESAGPIVVTGERGSGRTSFIRGLPLVLEAAGIDLAVFEVPQDQDLSPDDLYRLLRQAPEDSVIVVDDLDRRAMLRDQHPLVEMLRALRGASDCTKARVVVLLEQSSIGRFETYVADFGHLVPLRTLDETSAKSAIDRAVEQVTARYEGVTPDAELLVAVAAPPARTEKVVHPGLAARRLDLALARAAVEGRDTATMLDLHRDGSAPALRSRVEEMSAVMKARVKGQDSAIEAVTRRLALTRSNLDLRPERPNGVFLFVGPTGVGKTELAREIARVEYGGEDALIRLDMSEYSDSWGVSRLTGPMPGYVGSDTPDDWLTTKVANLPRCVVLLDEIEKAHPVVWNVFLQVFDAGRLSDSRGVTADFRDAVVVMTSNIGVRESNSKPIGFGVSAGAERSRALALDALKDTMPPELLNRIDEVAQFEALSPESITEIARVEVDGAVAMLASRGWTVTVDDDVIEWLATTGYDPAYGARHLQRNIERRLLGELVRFSERGVSSVRASVRDGEVVISEA